MTLFAYYCLETYFLKRLDFSISQMRIVESSMLKEAKALPFSLNLRLVIAPSCPSKILNLSQLRKL
jgi:hypothetical protein